MQCWSEPQTIKLTKCFMPQKLSHQKNISKCSHEELNLWICYFKLVPLITNYLICDNLHRSLWTHFSNIATEAKIQWRSFFFQLIEAESLPFETSAENIDLQIWKVIERFSRLQSNLNVKLPLCPSLIFFF